MDPGHRSLVTPRDEQFLAAFDAGEIASQSFHHRDHLRLAWVQILRLGLDDATEYVTVAIQHFAAHHGQANRYHDTMTRFWVRAVSLGIDQHPELSFEGLLAAESHLLDKNLPFFHWSRERMGSEEARRRWVEPDIRSMP